MATLVLSAAGSAIGGAIGGGVWGIPAAALGRAAGASLGRIIDQRILGNGSAAVESGRIDRLRITSAGEGAAIPKLFGRSRVGGHVVWASDIAEHVSHSGGGKGAPTRPAVDDYSYTISLAVALGEGAINHVARVWLDGEEVAPSDFAMRVYPGDEDQLPDPLISATEGENAAPAFRGTAYVVFEDLPLSRFGNRIPVFSFEVIRASGAEGVGLSDMSQHIRAVAMIPGTGEYSYATTPAYISAGAGDVSAANIHSAGGEVDFNRSLNDLTQSLPKCRSVSLVVSWFGTDLRCGDCRVAPRVERKDTDAENMPWSVSGITRDSAQTVPTEDGRAVYGGTPSDQSVLQAIKALKDKGLKCVFNPFLLMEQMSGNNLIDPWSGAAGQPALPWRGRITTSLAPGQEGSPDQTARATEEVAAFFATTQPEDFILGDSVRHTGAGPMGYRGFILHYAHLCALAGGVDAFLIGSELRGLTQIRSDTGFPAVEELRALLRDVRVILGPKVKLGYGADWSEYHGYQPAGTSDKLFHLDPLWAEDDLDFIGIDNYVPLSDWREDGPNADAAWGSTYNLGYLKSNIEGGEYFDWYYPTPSAERDQIRAPITDGYGQPWIWRAKDIRSWWSNPHYERIDGVPQTTPTPWRPQSKPIWFTELGCAAIDKGTNQPNCFLDPKSSESKMPRGSTGLRDDFIQAQYLQAMALHYGDEAANPVSSVTGQRMVDLDRMHVWAWDARPFPAFPARLDVWSDGLNYDKGHWLNGRVASRSLASVVAEICAGSGLFDIDVSALYGVVRGYVIDETRTGREALQPLMLAYGFDAFEDGGKLVFRSRGHAKCHSIDPDEAVVREGETTGVERIRQEQSDICGNLKISYLDGTGAYEPRVTSAIYPDESAGHAALSELPLVLMEGEAHQIAQRWLAEGRAARDQIMCKLPLSRRDIRPGDHVVIEGQGNTYRVDEIEKSDILRISATGIEPSAYRGVEYPVRPGGTTVVSPPVPVELSIMDLPLLSGDEDPVAPYVAASTRNWPGDVALYSADQDAGYVLSRIIPSPAVMGVTLNDLSTAQTGRWDRGVPLRVRLFRGALSTVSEAEVLNGANLALVGGNGAPDVWEVFQFRTATLVGKNTYDLTWRLRGQAGSDGTMPEIWPVGATFILMSNAVAQIPFKRHLRGVERHYRYGPASKPLGDPSFRHQTATATGAGLRPYRVAHLTCEKTAQGVRAHWIRRTRIDGDFWNLPDVPLGETLERYVVRVSNAGAVVREVSVETPEWIYSTADQTADGLVGEVTISVAQMSEHYGAGPFAHTDLSL